MSLTPEQIKVRRQWVEALRSGKYTQTTAGVLRDDDGRHCCLGVLCEIVRPGKLDEPGPRGIDPTDGYVPDTVARVAGIHRKSFQDAFIALNDAGNIPMEVVGSGAPLELPWVNRHDFLEIADTIELLTLAGE